MHMFLYEWATGGGLVDQMGSVPASILREGTAMVGALVADLVRIKDCRVTVLRDVRVLDMALPGCELIDIDSEYFRCEQFKRLAAEADGTIVIAPEFDQLLLRAAESVLLAEGTLFSPSPKFIRIAADKQRTARALAAAGVPVPDAVCLEPDERLPEDFDYPAVLKPVEGAGSQDTQLIVGPHDMPRPYAWPRRLERYCPGMSASVAMLCGPARRIALPPCQQLISEDGRLRYLGGRTPLPEGLSRRATELATRAIEALPVAHGYVGIDMVLGREPDGGEDYVLDVNPRLTTSYVGLRALAADNLAGTMLAICRGESPEQAVSSSQPLEFDTEGNVSYV